MSVVISVFLHLILGMILKLSKKKFLFFKKYEEKRHSLNQYLKILNEEGNFSIIGMVKEITKHFHKTLIIIKFADKDT